MNTRFDGQLWIGAFGVTLEVKEMETDHLLNTVKMLLQKPARVQAMLVEYVKGTTLFNTMLAELESRGVNTENILQLYTMDEAFRN